MVGETLNDCSIQCLQAGQLSPGYVLFCGDHTLQLLNGYTCPSKWWSFSVSRPSTRLCPKPSLLLEVRRGPVTQDFVPTQVFWLAMYPEGIKALYCELTHILTELSLPTMWERVVCSTSATMSSVYLLVYYANSSGPRVVKEPLADVFELISNHALILFQEYYII